MIDVRQLKERTDDILRRVEKGGEIIDVADRGRVVARVVPAPRPVDPETDKAIGERQRRLADEIGKHWIDEVSAASLSKDNRTRRGGRE